MMQAIIEEFVRIILARLMVYLFGIVRGQISAQAADGTVTVQSALGEITNVQIAQPWPNCSVTGVVGCHVLLSWPISTSGTLPAGPGELPCVVAFLSGDFSKVQMAGSRPVARKDDIVDCGSLTLVFQGSGTYITPDGVSVPVVASTPFSITGRIDSGSEKIEVA